MTIKWKGSVHRLPVDKNVASNFLTGNPERGPTGRSGSGTDWGLGVCGWKCCGGLQLDGVLVEVRQTSVSSSGEPRCCVKFPMNSLGFSEGWMA